MPNDSIPLGLRLCNPANIRHSSQFLWDGEKPEPHASGFCEFVDLLHGVRAAAKNVLAKFRRGIETVPDLIAVLSPSTENPTNAYIDFVCQQTGFARAEALTPDANTLFALLRAIFRFELGGWFVDDQTIRDGIALAL